MNSENKIHKCYFNPVLIYRAVKISLTAQLITQFMNKNRTELFDNNRPSYKKHNMEDLQNELQQLQQVILQQEQQLAQHEQQLLQRTQQQAQQQTQQQQSTTPFTLSPEGVLNQFRQLKVYNGSDDYFLSAFTKSVEVTSTLCGTNVELYTYAMQIVYNEKLQGEAAKCIRQLGNNLDWNAVKSKLRQQFQPHKSYAELFNYCRYVKVSNLRELFEVFRNISYELNEL